MAFALALAVALALAFALFATAQEPQNETGVTAGLEDRHPVDPTPLSYEYAYSMENERDNGEAPQPTPPVHADLPQFVPERPLSYGSLGTRAYVSLLYSDDFEVAVRVLGTSLRRSGATMPMLCVCTEHVSHDVMRRLERESWHVLVVSSVERRASTAIQHPRFSLVYTKLVIWSLDRYGLERLVYLDGDILVLQNLDVLFECGPEFCATLRHEEFFNGGVLVLRTSSSLYDRMMTQTELATRARPNGEQDYLNDVFGHCVRTGTFFNASGEQAGARGTCQRLSFSYNAESLMYTLNGRWKLPYGEYDGREPALIHYDSSFAKPWQWPVYMLLDYAWPWFEARLSLSPHDADLDASMSGTVGLLIVACYCVACAFFGFVSLFDVLGEQACILRRLLALVAEEWPRGASAAASLASLHYPASSLSATAIMREHRSLPARILDRVRGLAALGTIALLGWPCAVAARLVAARLAFAFVPLRVNPYYAPYLFCGFYACLLYFATTLHAVFLRGQAGARAVNGTLRRHAALEAVVLLVTMLVLSRASPPIARRAALMLGVPIAILIVAAARGAHALAGARLSMRH